MANRVILYKKPIPQRRPRTLYALVNRKGEATMLARTAMACVASYREEYDPTAVILTDEDTKRLRANMARAGFKVWPVRVTLHRVKI